MQGSGLCVRSKKIHRAMRILSYLFLVFLLPMSGYCQIGISPIGIGGGGSSLEMYGPTEATPGALYTYTASGAGSLTWQCTGCEFELGGSLPPSYGKWPTRVQVRWTAGSNRSIRVQSASYPYPYASKSVIVNCGPQTAPMPSLGQITQEADACSGITRLNSSYAASGWSYYFQDSPSGTSTVASRSLS